MEWWEWIKKRRRRRRRRAIVGRWLGGWGGIRVELKGRDLGFFHVKRNWRLTRFSGCMCIYVVMIVALRNRAQVIVGLEDGEVKS